MSYHSQSKLIRGGTDPWDILQDHREIKTSHILVYNNHQYLQTLLWN